LTIGSWENRRQLAEGSLQKTSVGNWQSAKTEAGLTIGSVTEKQQKSKTSVGNWQFAKTENALTIGSIK
jgi:hypothetical protein